MNSLPTMSIYDNPSGASGTVLFTAEPGSRHSFLADVVFTQGITVELATGNAPMLTLTYK